jgi:hypothetical protein
VIEVTNAVQDWRRRAGRRNSTASSKQVRQVLAGQAFRRLTPFGWLPLASELLRLGDLFRGHVVNRQVSKLCRTSEAPCGRQVEPHVGEDIVLRHAPPRFVHEAETGLRGGDVGGVAQQAGPGPFVAYLACLFVLGVFT